MGAKLMTIFYTMKKNEIELNVNSSVIKASQYEEYLQAKAIIAQANQLALHIRVEAESAREDAKINGYKDGKTEALTSIAMEHVNLLNKMDNWVRDLEPDMVRIVENAVRFIIGNYQADEFLKQSLEKAIAQNSYMQTLKIRVSPQMINFVQENLPSIVRSARFSGITNIESDPNLAPSDCIFETPLGIVDLTVENQLFQVLKLVSGKDDK